MLARKYAEDYYYDAEPARVEAPQPKPKRKTRPDARLNSDMRSRMLKLVALLSVCAAVITAMSGMNASRGYALVQMQNEAKQLEMENRQLQLEISQLKAPQRIKDIATKDLGMVVPAEVYFASDR